MAQMNIIKWLQLLESFNHFNFTIICCVLTFPWVCVQGSIAVACCYNIVNKCLDCLRISKTLQHIKN